MLDQTRIWTSDSEVAYNDGIKSSLSICEIENVHYYCVWQRVFAFDIWRCSPMKAETFESSFFYITSSDSRDAFLSNPLLDERVRRQYWCDFCKYLCIKKALAVMISAGNCSFLLHHLAKRPYDFHIGSIHKALLPCDDLESLISVH